MPPEFPSSLQLAWLVIVDTATLFALFIGLVGLIVPVFPGLTVMWLATLIYALLQHTAGRMTGWDWFAFVVITLLMIGGNIVDNIIIARKMLDHKIPWSSILFAFAAGIIVTFTDSPYMILAAVTMAGAYKETVDGVEVYEGTCGTYFTKNDD